MQRVITSTRSIFPVIDSAVRRRRVGELAAFANKLPACTEAEGRMVGMAARAVRSVPRRPCMPPKPQAAA
jgi:hypothetical protein